MGLTFNDRNWVARSERRPLPPAFYISESQFSFYLLAETIGDFLRKDIVMYYETETEATEDKTTVI